jgi:hypothetical protein
VRYDVPLNEKISFNVSGMVSRRENRGRNGGFFSISSSTSFQVDSKPVLLKVKPLPSDGAPADFGGVVSSGLQLREYLDLEEVETNDVICITYEMRSNGYVPSAFMLPDAAFEIARDNQRDVVSYRRFFVAAGTNVTPKVEISYYDPESKSYQRASCGGSAIRYRPSDE